MKNLAEQGAWRRAYVHTRKTGNAGQADFSFHHDSSTAFRWTTPKPDTAGLSIT
ncbi:hypothetical protein ACTPOE_08080 [Castellaniella sp. WN]